MDYPNHAGGWIHSNIHFRVGYLASATVTVESGIDRRAKGKARARTYDLAETSQV